MMPSSSFGPMKQEEFAALVEAPYGAAAKAIRKHDPFWGREEGASIEWRVTGTCEIIEEGTAIVTAKTKEEALEAAEKLSWEKWSVRGREREPFTAEAAEPFA